MNTVYRTFNIFSDPPLNKTILSLMDPRFKSNGVPFFTGERYEADLLFLYQDFPFDFLFSHSCKVIAHFLRHLRPDLCLTPPVVFCVRAKIKGIQETAVKFFPPIDNRSLLYICQG